MEYNKIKTVPSLFEIEEPKATKSKDFDNGRVSYIVTGTIAKLTDEELANLCGEYVDIIKVYRNSPKHAVIILLKERRSMFYVNRYGNIKPTGWGVRYYFGI